MWEVLRRSYEAYKLHSNASLNTYVSKKGSVGLAPMVSWSATLFCLHHLTRGVGLLETRWRRGQSRSRQAWNPRSRPRWRKNWPVEPEIHPLDTWWSGDTGSIHPGWMPSQVKVSVRGRINRMNSFHVKPNWSLKELVEGAVAVEVRNLFEYLTEKEEGVTNWFAQRKNPFRDQNGTIAKVDCWAKRLLNAESLRSVRLSFEKCSDL